MHQVSVKITSYCGFGTIKDATIIIFLPLLTKKSIIMKSVSLSSNCVFFVTALLFFLGSSCQNKTNSALSNNQLIPVNSQQKTENQYVIFCRMGHNGANCKGCIMMNGIPIHVDCQGAGNVCQKASCVSLTSTGTSMYATTLDTFGFTNLDYLNMPDLSLSLEVDEGVYTYLNIPAQLVYRDTTTLQFTFTGLSFTSRPLY